MRSALAFATRTLVANASHVIPANMAIETTASRPSVVAALRALGSWKEGTLFATTWMPVNAVVPDANARAIKKASAKPVEASAVTISHPALSACMVCPSAVRMRPVTMRSAMAPMKK